MLESVDLFGQVVVTWPDVERWVRHVAAIAPDSPRFMPYVQAWRVADKVAAAKVDGTWWRSSFMPRD